MANKLSHIDRNGEINIVNISKKLKSKRLAKAYGEIIISKKAIKLINDKTMPKGNVFSVAKIAGIMAAKKTFEIIPLCHPLHLTNIEINISINNKFNKICIISVCEAENSTGVEMEALTAVSTAALTIYDMCKSVDKNMIISNIKLLEKTGGKSHLK
ncbi:MAG: Cyclic pyranopterin monophosphate synthase accessory protein [Alphaproteobacteria bacterium MarineAlpha2_Bin1]|nr:MAG: Cyclic pyranopterin monophosphate synthase accessory protein [Alphaproteobacteria bacterium MarineAlpha2_Bin1]|tara:strand:- start:542 stop:1012 length:471 start_codon:yes stop_codon:yes gene_type:complete